MCHTWDILNDEDEASVMLPKLALWVTFLSVPGVGLITANRLFSMISDWDIARTFSLSDWQSCHVSFSIAEKIREQFERESAIALMEKMDRQGVHFMMIEDHDYPSLLRQIHLPPIALFYLGARPVFDIGVAVVGTRKATSYGKKVAYDLAGYLSSHTVAVISGLAYGIDAAAHQGTVSQRGYTIAVLGSGVNHIYPEGNLNLSRAILDNGGTILSEFLPDTLPHKAFFPMRNRLISGMSNAVVVVEAGLKSGALITAAYAVNDNRDVYAVPGSIFSSVSQGTHELILDGAIPLYEFSQLLNNLGKTEVKETLGSAIVKREASIETRICSELTTGVKSLQDLHTILGKISMAELGSLIGEMELEGKVSRLHDGRYSLI